MKNKLKLNKIQTTTLFNSELFVVVNNKMFNKTLIISASAAAAFAADEADRVASIPDMATFDTYPVYSGYLNVSDAKALHYMFVES